MELNSTRYRKTIRKINRVINRFDPMSKWVGCYSIYFPRVIPRKTIIPEQSILLLSKRFQKKISRGIRLKPKYITQLHNHEQRL